MRVLIATPKRRDEAEFLACAARSRKLHRPWVHPPASAESYRAFLRMTRRKSQRAFLVRTKAGDLVGVVQVSEIVRGSFGCGFLGYYGFAPHTGQGYMTEGLARVLDVCFGRGLDLHRLEANIQPGNGPSLALVRRLGFRKEGYSPRYLKIGGRWRDHERWAILAEDWRRARASVYLQSPR